MADCVRFEKGTRYYILAVQQDLFGWVVVKTFGRTDSAMGQRITLPFEDEASAREYFLQACRRRAKTWISSD